MFRVELENAGESVLTVVKYIRKFEKESNNRDSYMTLWESKRIADNGGLIARVETLEYAEEIKSKFDEIGAMVNIIKE